MDAAVAGLVGAFGGGALGFAGQLLLYRTQRKDELQDARLARAEDLCVEVLTLMQHTISLRLAHLMAAMTRVEADDGREEVHRAAKEFGDTLFEGYRLLARLSMDPRVAETASLGTRYLKVASAAMTDILAGQPEAKLRERAETVLEFQDSARKELGFSGA